MKKIWLVVLLIIIISLTGCTKKMVNPLEKKENLHDLYFDVLTDVKKTDKKSGTIDSGMDWESYEYTYEDMIITITCYLGRDIEYGIKYQEDLKDITIKGINYRYKEIIIDKEHKQVIYYTQVKDNTYSIVGMINTKNESAFNSFMDTIVIK